MTEELAKSVFDKCFKRSYNVQFLFNTDIKELRQIMKGKKKTEKPILLLIWPEMFMSQYSQEFQNVLRNYNDMFDVFYCRKQSDVADLLNTGIMPKELVHMYIVDTK